MKERLRCKLFGYKVYKQTQDGLGRITEEQFDHCLRCGVSIGDLRKIKKKVWFKK